MKNAIKNDRPYADRPAHQIFLQHVPGGCTSNLNVSKLAESCGLKNSRLWFYVNGKSKWPADAWLKVMSKFVDLSYLVDEDEEAA